MVVATEGVGVDPARFRLDTFVADWVEPLSLRASEEPERRGHQGDWLLDSVLVAEAMAWIDLGQAIGYFADGPTPDLPSRAAVDDENFFPSAPQVNGIDQAGFARALTRAIEDLTPARRTFLSLVLFEHEDVFVQRLERVQQLAEALTELPWLGVPPRAVDWMAWGLDGADLPVFDVGPALWRGAVEHPAWDSTGWYSSPLTPRERRRLVEQSRGAIAAAVQWTLDYEQTPVELRIVQGERSRREADGEERQLPSWVDEIG